MINIDYELPRDKKSVPIQVMQPGENYSFPFGPSSLEITINTENVAVIRVVASDTCHLEWGDEPVATLDSLLLPVGVVEYFYIKPGQKMAVRQHDSSGILYVSVMV